MAHDYPPFTGGGLALGVREIVAALGDEFSFRIVSSRSHDHFADDRHRLRSRDGADAIVAASAPGQALGWYRESDAIVVHWTFSFRRLSTLLLLTASLRHTPTVLVVHTAPDHSDYNRIRHLPGGARATLFRLAGTAADRCAFVVALSRAHASALSETGFRDPHVVSLPVASDPYDDAWRRRDGRPLRTVAILGELSRLKGADAIPRLLPVLAPHFAVRIAGRGPLAAAVRSAAARLPPAQRANVAVSDRLDPPTVATLYRRADCVLVLSRSESQSRITLEAMSSGVVVLARPVGGLRDLVADDETGFFVEPERPDAIRDLLLRLATDPARVDRIRRRARALADDVYAASLQGWRDILHVATAGSATGARPARRSPCTQECRSAGRRRRASASSPWPARSGGPSRRGRGTRGP
jgi:glycosyltransferase involved in cell wall biosynthesis